MLLFTERSWLRSLDVEERESGPVEASVALETAPMGK
jgi:hypothetical protein